MAMHGAVLLADENKNLRVANERQKRKQAVKKKHILKRTTLTVAEAQAIIVQQPKKVRVKAVQPEVVINTSSVSGISQGNRFNLPSCMICKGFNHAASNCPRYW